MPFRKIEKNPVDFWREYEEKTGEKVLARTLGQYISGWEEFDSQGWTAIWGLIIATSGGFRFHHFPQQSWIGALTHFTGWESPREKTIFVPKEMILTAHFVEESRWWKKIFAPSVPRLIIDYRDSAGNEQRLLLEADYGFGSLVENLHHKEQGTESGEPVSQKEI